MAFKKYVYGTEFQSRLVFLELYPDSQQLQIDNLKNSGWSYVGILHDKDIRDDGELKKPHYHFLIDFGKVPKLYSTVCRKLGFHFKKNDDGSGLPVYGEPCRNFKSCATYLIHQGIPDKYQYDIEELFGDDILLGNVKQLLSSPDENTQMRLLLDIYDNYEGILTFRIALNLALQNNLYSTFRRGGSLLAKVIEEYTRDELSLKYREAQEMQDRYFEKIHNIDLRPSHMRVFDEMREDK